MMGSTFHRTYERDDRDTEVEVEFCVETWGSPPSGEFGPPEDYDPGEGPLVELVQAHTLRPDGSHAEKVDLTPTEIKRMTDHFLENPPEPAYPDDD
jgi:hypothetical protein